MTRGDVILHESGATAEFAIVQQVLSPLLEGGEDEDYVTLPDEALDLYPNSQQQQQVSVKYPLPSSEGSHRGDLFPDKEERVSLKRENRIAVKRRMTPSILPEKKGFAAPSTEKGKSPGRESYILPPFEKGYFNKGERKVETFAFAEKEQGRKISDVLAGLSEKKAKRSLSRKMSHLLSKAEGK